MKYVFSLLLRFHLVYIICYRISYVEGILGGFSAKNINQFEYQVSIRVNGVHQCGGVVIGQQHILTAAHCVITKDQIFLNGELSVIGGVVNILLGGSNKKEVAIEKIYVPAEYKFINFKTVKSIEVTSGDIAVLKLRNNLGVSENGIAKLPTSCLSYEDEKPIVSGFGLSFINSGSLIQRKKNEKCLKCTQLKYAETNIVSNSKCKSMYPIPIGPSHLCAQVKQHDPDVPEGTCSGDSGGPLVIHGNTVIGILSLGPRFCDERVFPSLYTKVGSFLPFIEEAMKDEHSQVIRVADCIITKKLFGILGSKTNVVEYS